MRELYGLFVKMEKETQEIDNANVSPDMQAKTIPKNSAKAADLFSRTDDMTRDSDQPTSSLPAIKQMKMNPTDLYDMNTSSFSPINFTSKMPQPNAQMSPNKFNNKSVLSTAGRDQLEIREDLRDIQEESNADNRSSLSNELQMVKLNH